MIIRKMYDGEIYRIIELIRDTVHAICSDDYTADEINAWVPDNMNAMRFMQALNGCLNLVATDRGKIVGFISIEENGFINRLFTHKDYQRQGIATRLLKEAEKWAIKNRISTLSLDSSKTAEGFYLRRGFVKSGVSVMEREGVVFKSSIMKKVIL